MTSAWETSAVVQFNDHQSTGQPNYYYSNTAFIPVIDHHHAADGEEEFASPFFNSQSAAPKKRVHHLMSAASSSAGSISNFGDFSGVDDDSMFNEDFSSSANHSVVGGSSQPSTTCVSPVSASVISEASSSAMTGFSSTSSTSRHVAYAFRYEPYSTESSLIVTRTRCLCDECVEPKQEAITVVSSGTNARRPAPALASKCSRAPVPQRRVRFQEPAPLDDHAEVHVPRPRKAPAPSGARRLNQVVDDIEDDLPVEPEWVSLKTTTAPAPRRSMINQDEDLMEEDDEDVEESGETPVQEEPAVQEQLQQRQAPAAHPQFPVYLPPSTRPANEEVTPFMPPAPPVFQNAFIMEDEGRSQGVFYKTMMRWYSRVLDAQPFFCHEVAFCPRPESGEFSFPAWCDACGQWWQATFSEMQKFKRSQQRRRK